MLRGTPPATPQIFSYRRIDFHPYACPYSKHLLGAVTSFYYDHWIKVVHLVKSLEETGDLTARLDPLEKEFVFYIGFIRGPYPESVLKYNEALERGRRRAARRAGKAFTARAALILGACRAFLADAIRLLPGRGAPAEAISSLSAHQPPLDTLMEDFRLG
jgi:hypothetical protein